MLPPMPMPAIDICICIMGGIVLACSPLLPFLEWKWPDRIVTVGGAAAMIVLTLHLWHKFAGG